MGPVARGPGARRAGSDYRQPMRRLWPFVPLLVLGCGVLSFTVEEERTTTVEGAGVLGEILAALDFSGLDDFDVTIEQRMADQGVEPGDLESVRLTRLDLAASPDLSFLESLEVYVSAEGVDAVRVAHGERFPEGQETVALELTDADLVDHVVAGGMRFRVEARGSAPVDDTEVTIQVEVDVQATAQGACNAAKGGG